MPVQIRHFNEGWYTEIKGPRSPERSLALFETLLAHYKRFNWERRAIEIGILTDEDEDVLQGEIRKFFEARNIDLKVIFYTPKSTPFFFHDVHVVIFDTDSEEKRAEYAKCVMNRVIYTCL